MNKIYHVGGVTIRVLGTGTFMSKLSTFDDIRTQDLANITLATTRENPIFLHANFESNRIKYEGRLSGTGQFIVKHITLHVKPVALAIPQ